MAHALTTRRQSFSGLRSTQKARSSTTNHAPDGNHPFARTLSRHSLSMDAAAGGLAFVDMAAPVPCFKMVEHAHSDAEGIVLVVCAIKEEAVHILAACDNVRHVDATPLFPWRYALGTVTGADSVVSSSALSTRGGA